MLKTRQGEYTPTKCSPVRADSSLRGPQAAYGVPIEIIPSKTLTPSNYFSSIDKLYWLSDSKPPQNYS